MILNEFENIPALENKDTEQKMKREDSNQSHVSGSRRTRSQVAPDWPVKDALILVNEIAAVEGDCLNALSTYQKWKIISDNCNVLDVARSSNQCRRKWDSLLVEYNKIKQWESQSNESYLSLDSETRNKFELPENFDDELFKAIDDVVRAQEDRSETDPDSDPEEEADMLELIRELGSKRKRRQSMPQQSRTEEKEENPLKDCVQQKLLNICEEEKMQKDCMEEKSEERPIEEHTPLKDCAQQNLLNICEEEKRQKDCMEEKSEERPIEEHTQRSWVEEKEEVSVEEKKQMMASKVHDNEELINVIVKGSKSQRQKLMPQQICTEEIPLKDSAEQKLLKSCEEEKSDERPIEEQAQSVEEKKKIVVEEKDQMMTDKVRDNEELIHAIVEGSKRKRQQLMPEENPLEGSSQQKLLKSCEEEKSEERPVEEHTQGSYVEEKEKISSDEKEQMMAAKLRANAEMIHAIVKGKLAENSGYGNAADLKSAAQDFQTDYARLQAEQLITCLGDIVSTLNEFCGLSRNVNNY